MDRCCTRPFEHILPRHPTELAAAAMEGLKFAVDNPKRVIFPDIRGIPLPMYESILRSTPFLFRVHDEQSSVDYHDETGFLARSFHYIKDIRDEDIMLSKIELDSRLRERLPIQFNNQDVRKEVRAHICNFHKEKPLKRGERAPWISTTPLWAWAVGEAIERKRLGILDRNRAQKIRMSVIDLRKLLAFERSLRLPDELGIESRTVFYGMELLRLGNQMNDPYAPAWTNHPQEVLVYAIIPASTIINTISFDSPGQYQATPWLDLPLPPWFFHRFESRSFSVHEVVWPRSHSADWFSGDEKGARISLLRNFKKWVVSKPVLGITDDIASAAFRLAEILVLPRETFQEAIEEARERAWYLEREAAEATETLVEYLEEEYHFPGLDKFPREDILADVHKLWNRTREMAEMIVLWGFDKVNDDYWKRLQKQIIFHGEKYVEAIEDLEVEVAKCEAGYDYYKSLREKRTVGLALSSRPNFALW